jgi:crotonobetainyl-CoA:carnitine CoA-transferase CaiB-like acyl-CoA transferase
LTFDFRRSKVSLTVNEPCSDNSGPGFAPVNPDVDAVGDEAGTGDSAAPREDAATVALDGLKVLDFSRVLAGPFATMMLGDLGANVIKVERPDGGDETRAWGPPFDAHGQATYFLSVNRNKRSVVLDLKHEADLLRARELALTADVLVENFRPGLMEGLGLDYEALEPGNPGLVYCSITGFGPGAGARLPGYDLLVQALGGLMSITGEPDRDPQKVGVALVDILTGLFATSGILAALRYRERSGRGQKVEVSLLASLLAALVNQGSAYTAGGVVPQRMGNAHPSISPYELYDAGDGQLVIAVGNDRQFRALCETIDRVDLAEDDRFATNKDRVANRDALREELDRSLRDRPAAHWSEALTKARVPAGPVNDVGGAFQLARELGLEPVVEIRDGDGPATPLTRNPITLSRTPASYRSAPPALGERGTAAW